LKWPPLVSRGRHSPHEMLARPPHRLRPGVGAGVGALVGSKVTEGRAVALGVADGGDEGKGEGAAEGRGEGAAVGSSVARAVGTGEALGSGVGAGEGFGAVTVVTATAEGFQAQGVPGRERPKYGFSATVSSVTLCRAA